MINGKRATPEDIYRIAIEEASILAALYTGPEIRIRVANKLMLQAWDKDESIIGKPIKEAVPDLEAQPFFGYFENVFYTGKEHIGVEERADLFSKGVMQTRYYNFSYKPLKYDDGTVWGIVHTAFDVTEQVKAKIALEESEKNFRNMILQSPVAMGIYHGPQFILQAANEPMLTIMGKTSEEVMDKPLLEGLPEVKNEGFEKILAEIAATGISFKAKELKVPLPRNGITQTAYIDFTYTPIREGDGTISRILAVAADVTENVKSKMVLQSLIAEKELIEKDLREQKDKLTQILETMAEGVGIIETSGKLTYANQMAQKILGLSKKDILSRTYDDQKWKNLRLNGTPLPKEEHPMFITMSTGKMVFDCEIAVQPPEGERIYISINAAPIINEQGEIIAGIGSFMDVTDRRKTIQQKDEFISVASHELKTPITSLSAGFQLLERHLKNGTDIPEKLLKILSVTKVNLRKLSLLVEDLLNVTKISNGQLKLKKTSFNMSEVITECCDHVRLQGDHELLLTGDMKVEAFADKQKIDQVVVNFVNNAVKYAPYSKIINLHIEPTANHIRVSVQDFGIGIDEERSKRIFERFYQVDGSGLQFSGLGLGLYISAEIIKQHGGEIGVESELGKGSTFWFTIPRTDED